MTSGTYSIPDSLLELETRIDSCKSLLARLRALREDDELWKIYPEHVEDFMEKIKVWKDVLEHPGTDDQREWRLALVASGIREFDAWKPDVISTAEWWDHFWSMAKHFSNMDCRCILQNKAYNDGT